MAIFKKKRANGTLSENWYYKFIIKGKRYKGSTFKTDKKEAELYVKDLHKKISALHDDDPNISDNEKQRNLLNFREKITAEIQGDSIKLIAAWDVFKAKAPAMMKKIPKEKAWAIKKACWSDFVYFLQEKYPDCTNMRDVRASMAQEYISLLKVSGKFNKSISYKGRTYQNRVTQLSASSINEYIIHIKQVFRVLSKSAGLLENPLEDIKKITSKRKKRDVFEIHELERIDSYIKQLKIDPPIFKKDKLNLLVNEALFVIGINTGLRKGDICMLKWTNVNFHKTAINLELSKTKENVFIPISAVLHEFLKMKLKVQTNEFVTPELAEMYQSNPDGISYRFKKLLRELNIESVKEYEGRSRKVSCKDIHSLRHTFCYLHGIQGTPLITVQSMVGHLDEKMTESYMMHQTEELKRDAIEKLAFGSLTPNLPSPLEDRKAQIISKIKS